MDGEHAPEHNGGAPAASMVGPVLRDIREQALRLSLEARDYFGSHWPPDPRLTPLDDRMVMNREMLFISARLSQVVLWALSQDDGSESVDQPAETLDVAVDEAAPNGSAPEDHEPPADAPPEPWAVDPLLLSPAENGGGRISYHPRFQALREGSLALYERVSRLHEQSLAEDPRPVPADS